VPPVTPPVTPPPLPTPPATVVPPAAVVSPPVPDPAAVLPAAAVPSVAAAPAVASAKPAAKRPHVQRRARLRAAKPHAGDRYRVRLSFGRVPVSTDALSVRCRARLAGVRMRGSGAVAGHVATCTWQLPAAARGERLVVHVTVSGRHGVSLARSARLLVGR
jgi:hypothetical protein